MVWELNKYSERTALLDDGGNSLSYRGLTVETEKLSAAVGRRCLVFCLCTNTMGSVLGYVAFMNGRIPVALLSNHIAEDLLAYLLASYKPDYLWVPCYQTAQFRGMCIAYEAYGYCLLETRYGSDSPLYEDFGLLMSTSGSTGSPKMVRQSYNNVLDNALNIVKTLEVDEAERPITTLPMHYTYGLSIINSHLLVGATILLTDKGLVQKRFWQFFKEAGATSFGGVPYTYEMLAKIHFIRMDLPLLKTMTQAGGKLPRVLHEKLVRFADETGRRFVVMYGQCEATARMGCLPPARAAEKIGSIGVPISGGHFQLMGGDGTRITTPHTTGELVYEGRNVALGYSMCRADLALGDVWNGKLITGDLAQFDEEGFYYIVGRKKRFLKIYGNRVSLDETEQLIMELFKAEVACAGVDDHMYIFLTDATLKQPVKEYVVEKTKLNPAAFKVFVIPEIPKNDSGKTLYKELEVYYTE